MENILVVKNLITHVNCSSQCAAVRMNLSLISTDPQLIFLSSSHGKSWRRLTSGISGKTMPGMGDGLNNSSPKTSTSLCLTSLSYKVPQTEKSSIIGILLPKLFWPTVGKNCSSDREKFLRSLEQFIQTIKGQNNFWYLFLEVSHKTFLENWVSKQSFLVLILTMAKKTFF